MKGLILLTLLTLSLTVSCMENETKTKAMKCFAAKEFVSAIRSIKNHGFENTIKSKLTLPGLYQSLGSAYQCLLRTLPQKVNDEDSILAKIGLSALYLSNCGKDVGMLFLVLDDIVQQVKSAKPDWVGVVIESVMDVMVGQQGFQECEAAIQYIIGLFKH